MELDALSQLIELYIHSGDLGEAIWSRIEFWSGVSFGAIAIAYLAPERLTPLLTTLIVTLYFLFCISLFSNFQQDFQQIDAINADIQNIAQQYSIDLSIVRQAGEGALPSLLDRLALLYIPGLFLATIGFLILTSYRVRRRENSDDA